MSKTITRGLPRNRPRPDESPQGSSAPYEEEEEGIGRRKKGEASWGTGYRGLGVGPDEPIRAAQYMMSITLIISINGEAL